MAVINRRGFLTGGIAATPLIGTALAAGPFQAKNVPALRGSRNSVVVPTHELAGNLSERLDFPAAWQVNVLEMAGYQAGALTPQQVAARLNQPIGTKTVRELAQGKKTAVITFDDMTRVTPVQAVAPWILGELKAAGLADENILFLTSFGTHRPMNAVEIATKLGKDIPRRYAWLNHDCFDNLKDVGETSRGNKIRLNQSFVGADLRICISGIKIHASAGYGGGAKAILPGVAGISTIEYNHEKIMRNTKTAGPFKVFKNEMRLDMIEAARFAKVDYTVQALFNQRLQPTHIYAGDIVDAHHEAVRTAVKHYAHQARAGFRYRGGQRVSPVYPGQQFERADWSLHQGRRHGRTDRAASAGHRSGALPQQPHVRIEGRYVLRPDRQAPQRAHSQVPVDRLFAVHRPHPDE